MRALNEPYDWWGWHGWSDRPVPLSITQIIQAGTMSPEMAALFWLSLERRASLLLVADPPSAGKTTVLTALLTFLPSDTRVYFTRGWGETFDLPPPSDDAPTYILVNEISDHLPVYSWGPYVVRVFELLAEGYSLGSTLHADSVEEAVAQLEEEVGVPRRHLARLTYVAALHLVRLDGCIQRRLDEMALLGPGDGAGNDLAIAPVCSWEAGRDSFRLLEGEGAAAALAARLGLTEGELRHELGRRARFLAGLVRDGVFTPDAVQRAVFEYQGTGSRRKAAR